jgi:hypothetical protein
MHCRPCPGTNNLACPYSCFFGRPHYLKTSSFSHHHDQAPLPPVIPKRRQRLEDPIITHASNYYATLPHSISQSSTQPPPLPPPRRIYQQSNRNGIYCDLFNLLESPSSPSSIINQKRKYNSNDDSLRRHHRPKHFENMYTRKVKNTNDRKHYHHYQQSSFYKEKEHQNDTLLSTEKTKKTNDIYQRCWPNKGFFRRIIHNYFCMSSTIANSGYSS